MTTTDRKETDKGVSNMVKKAVLLLVLAVLTMASFGCNTIRGVGRDISAVGDALSDAAGGNP
jgi:predicted small secreted protein